MSFAHGFDLDDDDEQIWVQHPFTPSSALHAALRDWEISARCPICRDFLNIPVSIVPCHHSFCSECIRNSFKAGLKSLKRQASCPVCRVQVSATGADFKCLVPNRTVETMVKKYQALRNSLRQSLSQVAGCMVATENDVTSEVASLEHIGSKRARAPSSADLITEKGVDDQEIDADHKHVPRKKRARTHYNGLKRKQLADLCASEGLSTAGSEQELRTRHETFITLYNAECDSFHPRTAQEIALEIERRERARKNEAHLEYRNGSAVHTKHLENLKKNLKEVTELNRTSIISSGNAEFDKKLKSNFARLAAECKKRMPQNSKNSKEPKEEQSAAGAIETQCSADLESTTAAKPNRTDDIMVLETSCAVAAVAAKQVSPGGLSMVTDRPTQVNRRDEITLEHTPSQVISEAQATFAMKSQGTPSEVIDLVTETTLPSSGRRQTSKQNSIDHHFQVLTNTREPKRGDLNVKRNRPVRSIHEPWNCQRCTFRNLMRIRFTTQCEVCGAQRIVADEGKVLEKAQSALD